MARPDRQTILLCKAIEAVNDLAFILEETLNKPSPGHRCHLRRKLKIIQRRLPRLNGEIKTYTHRRDLKVVTFKNLQESQEEVIEEALRGQPDEQL